MHRKQSRQGQPCLVRGKATRSALLHMRKSSERMEEMSLSLILSLPLANASLVEANLPPKAM